MHQVPVPTHHASILSLLLWSSMTQHAGLLRHLDRQTPRDIQSFNPIPHTTLTITHAEVQRIWLALTAMMDQRLTNSRPTSSSALLKMDAIRYKEHDDVQYMWQMFYFALASLPHFRLTFRILQENMAVQLLLVEKRCERCPLYIEPPPLSQPSI